MNMFSISFALFSWWREEGLYVVVCCACDVVHMFIYVERNIYIYGDLTYALHIITGILQIVVCLLE